MIISYPHITNDPNVLNGRACVEDTEVRVTEIVAAAEAGMSVDDLLTRFSSRPLTLGEVHAAIAYYHDNRAELEDLRIADEKTATDAEAERLAAIKQRFMGG